MWLACHGSKGTPNPPEEATDASVSKVSDERPAESGNEEAEPPLVVEPAPGIAPTIQCASAVHEGQVFRGELNWMASNAWALDGSWQAYAPKAGDEAGTEQGWTGSTDPVSDTTAPESLADGNLHLQLQPTTIGWAASGVVQHGELRLPISCVQGEPEPIYRYQDGQCTDTSGSEGLNSWPIELVRETRTGECNQFSGMQLNEGLMDYPQLVGWNLRGARLDGADLAFGHIVDAQLEGAQMRSMTYGYANISGTIDDHTVIPGQGCTRKGEAIDCSI